MQIYFHGFMFRLWPVFKSLAWQKATLNKILIVTHSGMAGYQYNRHVMMNLSNITYTNGTK